MKEGFCLCRVN